MTSLALVLGALLLAGCGAGAHRTTASGSAAVRPTSPAASDQGEGGFLARVVGGALFILWTRAGEHVVGTLSGSYIDPSDQGQFYSDSVSFQGTISGASISLSFRPEATVLPTYENWNGTLQGSLLALSFTDSNGQIRTYNFHPASVADYNAIAAAAKAQADQAAATAQARQQHAQAVTNAEQPIDAGASSVQGDLGNVSGDISTAQSDLASVPKDLASEANDVATAKSDLQTALRDSADQVCTDADGVSTDADGVASDDDGIQSDNDAVTGDLSTIANDIAKLRSDFAALQSAESTLTSYVPSGGLPSQNEVSTALASAQTASTRVRQTMNGYLAQSKQMLQTARRYAAQAQTACKQRGGG